MVTDTRNKVNNILLFIYLILISLRYINGTGFFTILVFSFFVFLIQLNIIFRLSKPILITMGILMISTMISVYFNGYNFSNLIQLIGGFGIALLFFRTKVNTKLLSLLIIGLISYLLYMLFIIGVDKDLLIARGSRNFVGALPLALTFLYTACLYRQEKRFNFFVIGFTLFFVLILIGRSNIVSATYLLFISFLFRLSNLSIPKKVVFILFLSIIFYILQSNFMWFFIESTSRFSKTGIESSARDFIRENYFSKLDFYTVITGVSKYQAPFYTYNSNFHNSFLEGHSNMGIGFLILIFSTFILFIKRIKLYSNKVYIALFMGLSLRGFTDIVFFIDDFDFIFYFLIILIFYNKYGKNHSHITVKTKSQIQVNSHQHTAKNTFTEDKSNVSETDK